jgi:signal-transduction protein with cAMP-binding, CBS, and nucleotidyltransferase domain
MPMMTSTGLFLRYSLGLNNHRAICILAVRLVCDGVAQEVRSLVYTGVEAQVIAWVLARVLPVVVSRLLALVRARVSADCRFVSQLVGEAARYGADWVSRLAWMFVPFLRLS